MIEIAIDRENPRADQLASIRIDDPGRGNLGEAFYLLGNPLVQGFFLGEQLRIRQPGQEIVDARSDENVRVENLGRILFGDGRRVLTTPALVSVTVARSTVSPARLVNPIQSPLLMPRTSASCGDRFSGPATVSIRLRAASWPSSIDPCTSMKLRWCSPAGARRS